MKDLVQQAIDTHKAIYGEEPPYEPYRGASDHPFEGIHPTLMQELTNATAAKSFERRFKRELNRSHKAEGDFKVGDFVRIKRMSRVCSPMKSGKILFKEGGYYAVVDLDSIKKPCLTVVRASVNILAKRTPAPGERDAWDEALSLSQSNLQSEVEVTKWKKRSDIHHHSEEDLAIYVHHEVSNQKYLWVTHIYPSNILKVRLNSSKDRKDGWNAEKYIWASKVRIAEESSTTSD
jgi:hypothetical protein